MTTSNNYRSDDDDRGAAYGDKLIPEWRVSADDQILAAGLAVVAAMLLAFGWNIWRGSDGDVNVAASAALEELDGGNDDGDLDSAGGLGAASAGAVTTTTAAPTTTEAPTTTSTTVAEPVIGDVQAAVDPFAGDITGSNDGSTALLTGFVANDAESQEAEDAALAVEGIESVDNQLVVLEPGVLAALEQAGVTGASATGVGTEITVSGTIDTEDDRRPALDAAAAVAGVTSVIDNRLEVSVTADLNLLPQVQFATNSANILPASFADLDAAAALLAEAGDVAIEVQGYTDVRGDEQLNLELSQARADSVRQYLVDAGIGEAELTAVGYGETEQFAAGDTAEAYQANRLVRFQQTG